MILPDPHHRRGLDHDVAVKKGLKVDRLSDLLEANIFATHTVK